jgi:CheY-like chemotaxis protein
MSPAASRILLVDDDVDAADTMAEFLALLGHEVRVAHDGPRALELAAAFAPDVVLLDIGLPGMNGHEVARALRAMPRPPRSVVAISGYRPEDSESEFDAHLVKPIELSVLKSLLPH